MQILINSLNSTGLAQLFWPRVALSARGPTSSSSCCDFGLIGIVWRNISFLVRLRRNSLEMSQLSQQTQLAQYFIVKYVGAEFTSLICNEITMQARIA